jgi:hypothetical protein
MIAGDDIDTAALPQTPLSSHPSFDAISAFLTHVLARAALYVASPSTLEAALSATSLSPGVVSAIKATYAKAGKALALKARASASTALPLLPASVPALTTVTAETSIVVSHSDMAKAREPRVQLALGRQGSSSLVLDMSKEEALQLLDVLNGAQQAFTDMHTNMASSPSTS